LTELKIEGISQASLNRSVEKMKEIVGWAAQEKIDRWAFRASLLKALYDDADEYFKTGEGTFREIAAFDNGVATALKEFKDAVGKQ
jgi:hypothetical protein